MTIECHASYLRDAFQDTDMVIERVAKALEGKDYDTIVGSGVSGAILLLKLRDRFKCNVQVASGNTVKHILRQIRKQLHDREGVYNMPKFVGVACYCYSGPFCGIEQWIDASDDRFVLPELPVENKQLQAYATPAPTMSPEDVAKVNFDEPVPVKEKPREFWQSGLAPESSATPEQIFKDCGLLWERMTRMAYYGSIAPTPRSPIISGDTSV